MVFSPAMVDEKADPETASGEPVHAADGGPVVAEAGPAGEIVVGAPALAEEPVVAAGDPAPAEPAVATAETAELPAVARAELAEEPDYPPPNSVPRPPPPVSLRVFAQPVVDDVAPAAGPVIGGTKLALTGNHLFRASIVRVGGIIAQTVGASEPRELRVLTPSSERPGAVDVTVENPFVPPTVLPKAFRYEALAAPRIAGVAPERVATKGGTEITVAGEGFLPTTAVLVDGKVVETVRFVSAKALDVKAPPGDDGKMVDVAVKNPDGQTAVARRAFVYDKRFG